MEVSDQLHVPAALHPRKEPWYPLDMRLGGPQSRSGRGGEEKNYQPPLGIEPYNPNHQPVVSMTNMSNAAITHESRDLRYSKPGSYITVQL
jgi:hypothetical protein